MTTQKTKSAKKPWKLDVSKAFHVVRSLISLRADDIRPYGQFNVTNIYRRGYALFRQSDSTEEKLFGAVIFYAAKCLPADAIEI